MFQSEPHAKVTQALAPIPLPFLFIMVQNNNLPQLFSPLLTFSQLTNMTRQTYTVLGQVSWLIHI